MIHNKEKLHQLTNRWLQQNKLQNLSICLSHQEEEWHFNAGDFEQNASYFVASTTKLFITALFLQLQAEGRLNLEDYIAPHLHPSLLDQLHVWRGKDYSQQISFKHLLSHTSGLADYFEQAPKGKESLRAQLLKGNDCSWNLQNAIESSRAIGAQFPPGHKRKALYSDTNYQ
ncbi:MAG: beta-lactamase family protein, partial [Saprospiraceae bacterium]|nr:beta-lactamase family protein [Saprospiraceae bacterium]